MMPKHTNWIKVGLFQSTPQVFVSQKPIFWWKKVKFIFGVKEPVFTDCISVEGFSHFWGKKVFSCEDL